MGREFECIALDPVEMFPPWLPGSPSRATGFRAMISVLCNKSCDAAHALQRVSIGQTLPPGCGVFGCLVVLETINRFLGAENY